MIITPMERHIAALNYFVNIIERDKLLIYYVMSLNDYDIINKRFFAGEVKLELRLRKCLERNSL